MGLGNWATWYNIVLIILAIIVLVEVFRRIWHNHMVNSIREWPRISARVLKMAIKTSSSNLDGLVTPNPSELNPNASYTIQLVYEYNSDGQHFVSNKFAYGEDSTMSGRELELFMSEFNLTPGSNINVYYNKDDPQESYVYPGNKSYVGIVVGLAVIAGIIGIIYYYQENRASLPFFGSTKTKNDITFGSESANNFVGGGLY